jgi:putative endonuclease
MGAPFFVYILASKRNGTLYVGVTNNLARRSSEHKAKLVPGFTRKYEVDQLVYFETFDSILQHDPEKWVPVFPRDKREAFARRSCSNKKIERDDDSKKSHPALEARAREHSLKRWRRAWKIALIEKLNPDWRNLTNELNF